MKMEIRRKDVILVCLFTIGFFCIALWGLGSHSIPQTEQELSARGDGAKEVVLYFEEGQQLSDLLLFIGYRAAGEVTVSVAAGTDWQIVQSGEELDSVFAWNEIPVSYRTTCLGLVFSDASVNLMELVCLDENGEPVLPVNAMQYPALFDEQELYEDGITYQDQTIFDEIYHGRTAYEFLHGLPIYENTHPPLGKTLISVGIAVFGMNPFGWRFMCVVFGSLMMPFIYLFGLRLTGKTRYACLAAVLLGTDFMHFTLSRIATIDIIVAFFVLGMFYFMYAFVSSEKRRYLLLAGLFTGLGCATKWTGIYALCGLFVVFLLWMIGKIRKIGVKKETRRYWTWLCLQCIGCFILLPFTIYTLSYIPFVRVYPDQNLLQHVLSNGELMLSYHKATIFDHPYASPWYSWLFDWKPLLDSREYLAGDKVSVIATFGNPVLYFAGLYAYGKELWRTFRNKDKNAAVLVLYYTVMLLPWIFIRRTVFIYQYYVCSVVLILLLCHSVSQKEGGQEKRAYWGLLAASVLLFVVFYPVISGLVVPAVYIRQVIPWLPNWRFL